MFEQNRMLKRSPPVRSGERTEEPTNRPARNGVGRSIFGALDSATATESHRERQLVLMAEDNPDDWQMYGKLLWYNGFDVIHSTDGETSLQLARERRPDLILIDVRLPRMNGLEVCRALKADPETAGIPVIALSAHAERQYGEPAREAGCLAYMEKPASPIEVLHRVEDVIGRAPLPGAREPQRRF